MLEKFTKKLQECNLKMIEHQFEAEDLAKEILFYATDKTEEQQEERRKFLNKRLENRKNLYIYPAKSNA
jgi:hypothetical protein